MGPNEPSFLISRNYPTDTVSIIRIIFFIQSNSIISHRNQSAGLRYIKPTRWCMMAIKSFACIPGREAFGISVRNFIRRKTLFPDLSIDNRL